MSGLVGEILEEKYEIIELIGQGGMAMVYKAKDIRLNRFVAIKVLKSEFMDNEQFLKKFMREAQSDAKLTHPNIVNVYDIGSDAGLYFIVMEFIDGKTLKGHIKAKRKLSSQETAELCLPIAQALHHAHLNNIIHRDIKPHNILLTSAIVPKVADFGIARAITSSTITATEEALGSVHYISPEQARGGFLDARSDLYSLGIMMFEMLLGYLPYDADTPVAVALKHVQNKVPDPSSLDDTIPKNISQVVINLTRRKADDRYQSATELISDLRKLIEDPLCQLQPTYEEDTFDTAAEIQRFEARNQEPEPQEKRQVAQPSGRMRIVLLSLFVVLLSVGAVLAWLMNRKVTLPPLEKMKYNVAIAEIEELKLKHEVVFEHSKDVPVNLVIRTEPGAGDSVEKGSYVILIISKGPARREIPDVVGMQENAAKLKIEDENFSYGEINSEFNDEIEKGVVIRQSPEAGEVMDEGTGILLYISLGRDIVKVPNVSNSNMTLTQATEELAKAGLRVGDTKRKGNSSAPGIVIEQSKAAGTEVARNSKIDLTVSKGPLTTISRTIDMGYVLSGVTDAYVQIQVTSSVDGEPEEEIYADSFFPTTQNTLEIVIQGYVNDVVDYFVFVDGVRKYQNSTVIK
ncbi:MAG: Stk1 family PASTA domain-containing Ser/Thr kinase [Eubacteriaceae bacterium]|nr:Stk1 family PASTA domain-containing Ser/Thr kinase [Eubacteriaceae bacterium]